MIKSHIYKTHGTQLAGVVRGTTGKFIDSRGYFSQVWTEPELLAIGFRKGFIQLNLAESYKGVLRGMHRQNQSKLVQVVSGKIFDVILNPETGEWAGYELSTGDMLFVPPEYAHGYLVVSDSAVVQYVVDAPYNSEIEETFRWDDYGIQWPLQIIPTISKKDAAQ